MANDYVLKTIDPRMPEGPPADIIIPARYYSRLYKEISVEYENLRSAKEVLAEPNIIFHGVRDYDEGGWCFVGRPKGEWFIREQVTAPFPPGRVFAVYLNPLLRVYECRAEKADGNNPLLPFGWKDRYQGIAWKRIF